MHPLFDCPAWPYEKDGRRQQLLAPAASQIVEDIRKGRLDTVSLLCDTRPVHERLFAALAPKGREYLAGHYRGEDFHCLRYCPVQILANPLVGTAPEMVATEIEALRQQILTAIPRLDAIKAIPDKDYPAQEKLLGTVEIGCQLCAEFFRIHPYANGNGHAGRFFILAFLWRYGYWPKGFSIEPRPINPAYSTAIKFHQQGKPQQFEQLILTAIKQKLAPPPAKKK